MIDVAQATAYAARHHAGQQYGANTDDAEPYFNHVYRVAEKCISDFKGVALCHDLIEDTDLTIEDLIRDLNPDTWEIKALNLLTRDESETYAEYIERIHGAGTDKGATCARHVKLMDLAENRSRLSTKMEGMLRRYRRAEERLRS